MILTGVFFSMRFFKSSDDVVIVLTKSVRSYVNTAPGEFKNYTNASGNR